MAEEHDVLMVTGLTPDPALTPPAPVEQVPAAPPPEEGGEAKLEDQPAASEVVDTGKQDDTAQAPAAPSEQATAEPPAAAEAPKKPARGVQKALDRLASQRDQAQRERDQAVAALAAMQQAFLAQQQPQRTQQQAPPADPKPEQSKYPTWESYNEAVAQWTARETAREEVRNALSAVGREAQAQQARNSAQAQATDLQSKLRRSLDSGPTRFKDWDDVVVGSEQPMTPSLLTAIASSDDPALVTHYLATHPEEHDKIIALPHQRQFYEIGRIIAQATAPVVQASKAPPPARTVGGGKSNSGASIDPDKMNPAQYRAWITAQGMTRGLK